MAIVFLGWFYSPRFKPWAMLDTIPDEQEFHKQRIILYQSIKNPDEISPIQQIVEYDCRFVPV